MNINTMDFDLGKKSLLQFYKTLNEKGIDLIFLTEKNVHSRPHVRERFSQIIHQAWQKQKINFCTSESNLPWNSTSKLGGIAMIALKNLSLVILHKGQDPSGMIRRTLITVLSKQNKRTAIISMYHPGNTSIYVTERSQ